MTTLAFLYAEPGDALGSQFADTFGLVAWREEERVRYFLYFEAFFLAEIEGCFLRPSTPSIVYKRRGPKKMLFAELAREF